ncbi:arsenical pump-driving ATPase GET3 [Marinobacter sp. AN1]|uniref:arsenical pump-driving ATPase GET3 n=1 Tax=Marinobacter sp. AN1 TaxID=2886046 RepID=UPI0022318137|nr:arsenical pump-driving ATPase GET3 [Marinobacter sp. AN1]UZD67071.1 arsenical pump-driving ATPase GET3 [Marinobacter sp. AN1]
MNLPVSIRHLCLIMTLALTFLPFSASGQSAEELLKQINERKERINQFRALLNDPDQTTRLAALDVMLKSEDPAMKEIAYGAGFSSADDAMRALALKGKFRDLQVIPFKLTLQQETTETEEKILQKWAGTYRFQLAEFDEASGRFVFVGNDHNSRNNGQVSGTGMEFQGGYCRGDFTLGDGASLIGEIRCQGGYEGTYIASARLH